MATERPARLSNDLVSRAGRQVSQKGTDYETDDPARIGADREKSGNERGKAWIRAYAFVHAARSLMEPSGVCRPFDFSE